MRKIYSLLSFAIIGLGVLHSILTFLIYKTLDVEASWFFCGGLVTVFSGFFNYILLHTKEIYIIKICQISNFLILTFFLFVIALFAEPHIIGILAIQFALMIFSLVYPSIPNHRKF